MLLNINFFKNNKIPKNNLQKIIYKIKKKL